MTLYTRKGDQGVTSLLGGRRVAKDDPRVEAYGSVDEVCAFVGMARVEVDGSGIREPEWKEFILVTLDACQDALMRLCAQTASPDRKAPVGVESGDIEAVERAIDRAMAAVEPLERFVLPGATRLEASLHVARTVCRRAERRLVAVQDPGLEDGVRYLNRLSDLLFAMARLAVKEEGRRDRLWQTRTRSTGEVPSGSRKDPVPPVPEDGGEAPTGNTPAPSRVGRARRLARL